MSRDQLSVYHTEPRMHRQEGFSLGHAYLRLEVPIGKSIKDPKIHLSQIMNRENETVGRQKLLLLNFNHTFIAYQRLVSILIGDVATQKLIVGIIPDACHSIIPKSKLFCHRATCLDGK
jgi:hypothetical protein